MVSEDIPLPNRSSSSKNLVPEELSEHDSHEEEVSSKKSWTREQLLVVVTLVVMLLFRGISYGLLTPFFPSEAAEKGASPVVIGLAFGIFQLAVFVTSPVYGLLINDFGAKAMCLYGCFLLGGCNIAFGFLDRCPDGPIYITLCLISRIIQGNGAAMTITSAFALLSATFPNNLGTAAGLVEVCAGVGIVLGPAIGGALYSVGGSPLPLVSVGSALLVILVIAFFTLPSIERKQPIPGGMLTLLKIPGCLILYLVIVSCGISLGNLDPNFNPFMLKTFPWITVPQIGLIFSTTPGVYAVIAPVAGYISNNWSKGALCLGGLLTASTGFFLVGPNPWLARLISPTIPETIIALALIGLGAVCVNVPTYPMLVRLARNKGFPEDISTYGLLSGLYGSGFSLGAFLGPTVAGVITHKYGFAWSFSSCTLINMGAAALLLTYIVIMRSRGDWPIPIPEKNDAQRSDVTHNSNSINDAEGDNSVGSLGGPSGQITQDISV